jgi:hypothetical protein
MLRKPWLINALTITVVVVVLVGVIWGLLTGWLGDTAFVATGAGLIAWLTYLHRYRIDNRAEWWRRVQSAIDLLLNEDDKNVRNTGLALLINLADDPALLPHDHKLISDMMIYMMDKVAPTDDSDTDEQTGSG